MQRGGAARARDGVRRARPFGERRLEGRDARAHRQPAGAQRLEDRLDVLLAQRLTRRSSASASALTTRSCCSSVMSPYSGTVTSLRAIRSALRQGRPEALPIRGELVHRGIQQRRLDAVALAHAGADGRLAPGVLEHERHHVAGRVRDALVRVGDDHAVDAAQQRAVAQRQLPAALDVGGHARHARAQQRGARLVQAQVERAGAQPAHALGELVVVRREQAALADGEHLVGEEREAARRGPRRRACGRRRSALRRVGGVLDQREAVLLAQRAQDVDRAG